MTNKLKYKELLENLGKENNWDEVLKVIQRPLNNAERRDKYQNILYLDQGSNLTNSEFGLQLESKELSPEQALIEKESNDEIYTFLCTLSDKDGYLIARLYEEAALTTIAREMKVSITAVHKRKEKLKKKIKEFEKFK